MLLNNLYIKYLKFEHHINAMEKYPGYKILCVAKQYDWLNVSALLTVDI